MATSQGVKWNRTDSNGVIRSKGGRFSIFKRSGETWYTLRVNDGNEVHYEGGFPLLSEAKKRANKFSGPDKT